MAPCRRPRLSASRNIRLDPDIVYVDHGDAATSAGTATGIDLGLHLV
jgi:AraC family transcriptional activator FtrA